MAVFAQSLMTTAGIAEFRKTGDVPMNFRMEGKLYPIGRYLRSKLREEIGMPDHEIEKVKQRFLNKSGSDLLYLLQSSIDAKEALSSAQVHTRQHLGGIQTVEARSKIHKKRLTL